MTDKLKLTLEWENNNFFQLEAKTNDDPVVAIIRVEENSCIGSLWPSISQACASFLRAELDKIGDAMKAA